MQLSAVEMIFISHISESIGYDLRLGDLSPSVVTLEDSASLRKNQTAVLINNDMTVAVLLWETGECAIIDSHAHGNDGAVISCVPPDQINTIVSWLAKMVLKYCNRVLGLLSLMTAHKAKANELVIFDTVEKNLWHVLFTCDR